MSRKKRTRLNRSQFFISKNTKGFTLIEISIFIVLAGILTATIVAPYLTSVFKSETPEIVISALFLAREKMEQLQATAYSNILDEPNTPLTGNFSAFSRQVTVTLMDSNLNVSGSDMGYKRVIVTVYHSEIPAGGISVTSLFTDYAG